MKPLAALTAAVFVLVFLPASPANATTGPTVLAQMSVVQADIDDVTAAADVIDLSALRDACAALRTDARRFATFHRPRHAGLPKASWRHLIAGMALYASAGQTCVAAVDDDDPNELDLATASVTQAGDEIDLATAALG